MVNHQLEQRGLKVKESHGAIIDATLIESASRPRKEMEGMSVDEEEDNSYVIEECPRCDVASEGEAKLF